MEPDWRRDLATALPNLLVVSSLGRLFPDENALARFLHAQGWLPENRRGETASSRWLAHLLARHLPAQSEVCEDVLGVCLFSQKRKWTQIFPI